MSQIVVQAALAAVLVAISSFAARRWGERVAGVISALPAIAGPFLLLVAGEHGDRAAASAANGTLAGLLVLSGFAVVYVHAARRHSWPASLAVAWTAAAALAVLVELIAPRAPLGVLLAVASLVLAWRSMPRRERQAGSPVSAAETLCLMGLAALLVLLLAHAVGVLGPQLGGALAGLPVIATVLAVNTHRRRGSVALAALMRGMLEGMAGFVVFCEAVAVLARPGGTAVTFAVAALSAVCVQAAVVQLGAARAWVRSVGRAVGGY